MSEEQILQQETPAAEKESFLKKILEHKLLIFLPAAVAVLAILMGYFTEIFGIVISGMPFKYIITNLFSNLIGATMPFIISLLLPAAVILAQKLNKPLLTKILFFVSLGFLAIQLFSALVCLILAFFDYGAVVSALNGFFGSFRGSGVLSSLYYVLRNLFSGMPFLRLIGYAFNNSVIFLAELLFLVKNILCGLLCLQMMKKK